MIEAPNVFPGVECSINGNFFCGQLLRCIKKISHLYFSRGQNPCWQTTQTSSGGTFGPRGTVFGGGWIHCTGSKSFTLSDTQRCFSPWLWLSSHSFSERCTSQKSQLKPLFVPKIAAFCFVRQLSSKRAAVDDATCVEVLIVFTGSLETWLINLDTHSPDKCHKRVLLLGPPSLSSWPLPFDVPRLCCRWRVRVKFRKGESREGVSISAHLWG